MRVMRVLTRPNVGGPTRQAIALWHALAAQGARTLLVVGECEAGEPALDPAAHGVPRLAAAAVDPRAAGVVVVPELRRGLHPLRDLRARARLRALLGAFAPDVVHTHTSKAGALARPLARRLGVRRIVHTYHGHVLQDYFGPLRNAVLCRLERRLASRTDVLVAVSPSCRSELVALGIAPAGRIQVVPPAVELGPFARGDRAAARASLDLAPAQLVLGFVGRLVPIKRPELFVEVVRATAGARGLVFGDGPLRAALAARAGDRVRWLGARRDLAALLPACDVLLIPSRREGCPLAAIEAFAAGVPVAGFDVPGTHDALATWGAGVLVPEVGGAAELTRGVARAIANRADFVRAASTGLSRFAPTAVARQLSDLYEQPG